MTLHVRCVLMIGFVYTGFAVESEEPTLQCMSSTTISLCAASKFCYYLRRSERIGDFEKYGCSDELENKYITVLSSLMETNHSSGCSEFGIQRLCYCFTVQCNSQWIIGYQVRMLTCGEKVFIFIGLASIIMLWNIIICWTGDQLDDCDSREDFQYKSKRIRRLMRAFIILSILKSVMLCTIIVLSWVPLTEICENHQPERKIAYKFHLLQLPLVVFPHRINIFIFIYLPFIHISTTFTSVRFLLPRYTLHIPRYCRLIGIEICEIVTGVVWVLLAFGLHDALMFYENMLRSNCRMQHRYWKGAVGFAYAMPLACCASTFVVVIIQSITRDTDQFKNTDSISTSTVEESAPTKTADQIDPSACHETIEIMPNPIIVNCTRGGCIQLQSTYSKEWNTVRILPSNAELSVRPQRFLIPPGRTATADLTTTNSLSKYPETKILVQWFGVGNDCPPRNADLLWCRPYVVPRELWHHNVSRIYLENEPQTT